MRLIRTPTLTVSVDLQGDADAPAVLLLHGWPDDATSWFQVAGALRAARFRTIIPMLRGFGKTHFNRVGNARSGNTAILAMDAIELMDELGIERFSVAGHDWGSSIAETLAVGWPKRIAAIAMLATPSRLGGLKMPSFSQARRYWYHWFQATARGSEAIENDPRGFARIMWDTWSPRGWFDEATFAAVARSFRNADWLPVTLHSYRSRWGEVPIDARSRRLESKVAATKKLATPTLFIDGAEDGVTPPELASGMSKKFSGPYDWIRLPGVGHFVQREAPRDVARHLARHFSTHGR
jgi:pimeloyl-ACP methyl ester carboxylesterase